MFAAIKSGLELALAPSAAIGVLFSILIAAGPIQAQDLAAGVVKVDAKTHNGTRRVGSGFIVRLDDKRAYILTAAHVVEGAEETGVVFSSRRLATPVTAKVVGPEHWDRRGLALLVVSATEARSAGAHPLPFSSEHPPRIGTELRLIGHPRTVGDWSSLYGRVAARQGEALKIQAAVDEGSSGGPVLEEDRVVGIVVEELAGIAVVIPVVTIRTYLEGYGVVPGLVSAPWTKPELAKLTVRSNVRDDLVYIDGKRYGPTRLDVELPPGTHLVRVEKEDYEPWETSLDLNAGGEEMVRATLQRRRRKPEETFRDCSACPEMRVIPAGTFKMGSPVDTQGRISDEGPVHSVSIAYPFALASREVTVGEFRSFVQATGYRTEAEKGQGCAVWEGPEGTSYDTWDPKRDWHSPGFPQGNHHPVVCVSWNDAKAYVAWLAKETGHAYRLPSEAEWEYAARAGTKTTRFWGEDPDAACDYANVYDENSKREHGFVWTHHACEDGYARTAAAGRFAANAFGLKDMLGNVWEWTEDCANDSYEAAPRDGSSWTRGDCRGRVLRGGGWANEPGSTRSSFRFRVSNRHRGNDVGFRPARTL